MRQLFLFTNTVGNGHTGWEMCLSMADDGKVLGEHICSDICFMKYDLTLRKDRKKYIEKHFGCQLKHIDICVLNAGETPPPHVIKANEDARKKAMNLKKEQDNG